MSYFKLRLFSMAREFYTEHFYSMLAKCLILFLLLFPESIWVGFAKIIENNFPLLLIILLIILKLIDFTFYRKQLLASEIKNWELSLPIPRINQLAIRILDKLISHTPAILTINSVFLLKYGISQLAFSLLLKLDFSYIAIAALISTSDFLLEKTKTKNYRIKLILRRKEVHFAILWLQECLTESPIRILILLSISILMIAFTIYRISSGNQFAMAPLFSLPLLSLLDFIHSLLRQKYLHSREFYDSLPLKRTIKNIFLSLDFIHTLLPMCLIIAGNNIVYFILLPNFIIMKELKKHVPKYYILVLFFTLIAESSLIFRIHI